MILVSGAAADSSPKLMAFDSQKQELVFVVETTNLKKMTLSI